MWYDCGFTIGLDLQFDILAPFCLYKSHEMSNYVQANKSFSINRIIKKIFNGNNYSFYDLV